MEKKTLPQIKRRMYISKSHASFPFQIPAVATEAELE